MQKCQNASMHTYAFVHSWIRAVSRAAVAAALVVLVPATSHAQIYETVGIRAQGMSGAFVAVSDDATTTWWNPAGLAAGGYFNTVLEIDRVEDSSLTRARAFSLTVPSLGISYYRLSLSGMRPPSTTGSTPASREDQGVLSQYGATVGQSIGSHVIVASTVKLVHALDSTSADLDTGAMAMFGRVRVGVSVRNLKSPEFGEGDETFKLPRQARTGVSFKAGSAATAELTLALDADLTTTPTAFGDVRHLAAGAEAWLLKRSIGVRGGVGINTVGETRRSGSFGASVAFRTGAYADAQLTRGADETRNGWGFGLRLTF
jgi:hypothetical protein